MTAKAFGSPKYGITRNIGAVSLADARERVTKALAAEGFGVLTEIDVQATLKKKIDIDTKPYLILGACNPQLAHRALSEEPGIGLLLPCNVVISERDEGTVVSALDPEEMFRLVGRDEIAPLASEVRQLVSRAVENA